MEVIIPLEAHRGPSSFGPHSQFHGVAGDQTIIQREKPWHRQAAYLFAAGRDRVEVARALEKSTDQVRVLMKQEWFQHLVTSLMAEDGKDITDLFKAEAMNSLTTLVDLRDDTEVAASVRLSSALAILDRAPNVGKPIQRVESMRVPFSGDAVSEVERLRNENLELQKTLQNEN